MRIRFAVLEDSLFSFQAQRLYLFFLDAFLKQGATAIQQAASLRNFPVKHHLTTLWLHHSRSFTFAYI